MALVQVIMAIHLTSGNRLRDYTLTTDMTSSDAGTAMWAFAEREGFDYFVKCFLTPVFPDSDAPGSERSKALKRARCEEFESRMNVVESTLQACGNENFLVRCVDFFREHGTYFKITKKIHPARLNVSELPAGKLMLVLLSAAYSLKILHEHSSFIHADIKPENFMIQRAGTGLIANLIDFDAGFFMGHAPATDSLIGDQRYWAPELIAWLAHDARSNRARRPALMQSLDVFSLGLTCCEYLTGRLPVFPENYGYAGEAVLDDAVLEIPHSVQADLEPLMGLIQEMLHKNPLNRPSAATIHEKLRDFNREHFVSDTTYRKIATSLKSNLVSSGESLRAMAKTRPTKSASRLDSDLKVRGLKAGEPTETASIGRRLRFRSKA